MKARFLAALLVVAACAPLAIAVDPTFPQSDQEQIKIAADVWNGYTKPSHQITFRGSRWHVLNQAPPDSGPWLPNGWTDPKTRTICIRPGHPGASTYEVALHELGHALGLGHTTTGVMMGYSVSTEFTSEVMAECRRVGACE